MCTVKRTVIGIAILLVTGGINFVLVAAQELAPTPSRTESGLYQITVVEPGYDVTVTEVEREARYSVIEMRGVVPTVTAGGVVLFRASYDIAKERGLEYTFTVPIGQGTTTRGSEGRQMSMGVKVFMTNDATTSLKELLGADYSEAAQQMFDGNGYQSLSELAMLFSGFGKSTVVPDSTIQFGSSGHQGTVKELIGQWQIVGGEFSGQPMPTAGLPDIVIKFDIYGRWSDSEGKAAIWSVDSSKSPKTLDLTYSTGPDQGKRQLCIYQITEDRLVIVYGIPGGTEEDRPVGFTTKDQPNTVMFIFKQAGRSADN